MKISPEHFAVLETVCKEKLAAYPDARDSYAKEGLSAKRFRWDILWTTQIEGNTSRWICDTLYPLGINDSHIDTALRRIVG